MVRKHCNCNTSTTATSCFCFLRIGSSLKTPALWFDTGAKAVQSRQWGGSVLSFCPSRSGVRSALNTQRCAAEWLLETQREKKTTEASQEVFIGRSVSNVSKETRSKRKMCLSITTLLIERGTNNNTALVFKYSLSGGNSPRTSSILEATFFIHSMVFQWFTLSPHSKRALVAQEPTSVRLFVSLSALSAGTGWDHAQLMRGCIYLQILNGIKILVCVDS